MASGKQPDIFHKADFRQTSRMLAKITNFC